jgi:protein subunit release factor A
LRSNDCWWTGTSIRQIVIRAGGLGEQHKNNTASVIHARWTHLSGRSYAIVVRDQRSQHQNRRLARELCATCTTNSTGALRHGFSKETVFSPPNDAH